MTILNTFYILVSLHLLVRMIVNLTDNNPILLGIDIDIKIAGVVAIVTTIIKVLVSI